MYKVDLKWDWLINDKKINQARNWCTQKFGKSRHPDKTYKWMTRDNWSLNTLSYCTCFYFEKEEHKNWFLIRWQS